MCRCGREGSGDRLIGWVIIGQYHGNQIEILWKSHESHEITSFKSSRPKQFPACCIKLNPAQSMILSEYGILAS